MLGHGPGNVADLLRLAARRHRDRELLVYGDARFTYGEFDARVDRLAGGLASAGVRVGDVVASLAYNSDALLALYFALARLGAVNVPLNTMLTEADVAELVARSDARALVYGPECADRIDVGPDVQLIPVAPDGSRHVSLAELEGRRPEFEPGGTGQEPAMVIFTSGSTGRPKGCVKSHSNLIWSATNCQLETPRRPGGVELYVIPLAGVGFSNFVLPSLMAGARIVLDRFDARRCLELIEGERVTHMFLAGSMLDAILRFSGQEEFDLSSLELVETAYQLSDRLRNGIAERFGPIVRYCYGSTEGTNWAAPADMFMHHPDCVGHPKGLDDYRIVDDLRRPVPVGEVGEVMVGGPTVMLGYLGDDEATAEVLHDAWLLTGDLGEMADDGMMRFRGRKKDMIKTGGMNVAAGEVELALARHPEVVEVAVIGVPSDQWGEAVTAVVVPVAGAVEPELVDVLRSHCREQLAAFKRPKEYIVVDELPRNPTGKIAKGVLRDTYA